MAKKKKNDDETNDLNLEDLKAYSEARLKAIRRAAIEEDKLRKVTSQTKTLWDSIAYSLLGISTSDFFTKIKASQQDIANNKNLLAEANEVIASMAYSLNNDFGKAITGSKRKLLDLIKSSKDISPDLANSLREAVKSGNIGDFLQEQGETGRKALQDLVADKNGFKKLTDFLKKDGEGPAGFTQMINNTRLLEQELRNPTKEFINWEKILSRIGDNIFKIFSPQNLLPILYEFDQILNTTQREFGINLDANSARFSDLVTNSARFGVSIQENATFMGVLSEHLRSTNPDILLKAADNMKAVKMATGLAIEEVANLTGQMMFFGDSSENVSKFIEETSNKSLKYGLASKKVLTEVSKALPDARKLGWQGGTKALADMVINAKKLGQSMDELINAGKKLRTLEGALESSADLALVGVNTNAIQMLAAARRGGKEFSSFVSNLTNSFGTLKKDGTVEFDPIDIDRLQVVAEATGVSIEGLQNQISASIKRNEKARLLPAKFFNLKEDEKEFLLNATKLDGTGKIQIAGNINGITEFNKLTPDMIRQMAAQKQTLEQQAQGNMSFKESVKGLKETFIHFLTHLQPVIAWLTDAVNRFSNFVATWSSGTKKFVLGLTIFGALFFSVARHFTNGYAMGQGFNAATTKGGFFDKIKEKVFGKKPEVQSTIQAARETIQNNNPVNAINNDGVEKASKLKEIFESIPSPAKILAIAAAIVALGFAFIEIGYGIKIASEGLGDLTKSFKDVKDSGMALGAVTVVMGGFVGMLALMIPVIKAIGVNGMSAAPGLLAVGAAVALMGVGIWAATKGLSELVNSFKGLTNSQAISAVTALAFVMGGFIGIIAVITSELPFFAAGITAVGAAGTAGAIGLLAIGAAAVGVGFGIKLAGEGIAVIVNSISGLISSFVSLTPLVAEFSKNILPLALGLPLIAVGIFSLIPAVSGLAAVGILSSVGLLALALSFGKLWDSMDEVANTTKSINISLGGISKTMDRLKSSIKEVVDSVTTLSILKNIAPSLNEIVNIKGEGLKNFNTNIKDTNAASGKLLLISNSFAVLTNNVKSFIKEFQTASSFINKGLDISKVEKSINKPQTLSVDNFEKSMKKPQTLSVDNFDFSRNNKSIAENISFIDKLQIKILNFISNISSYSNSINSVFSTIKEPNIKFDFLNKIKTDSLSILVDKITQYDNAVNGLLNTTKLFEGIFTIFNKLSDINISGPKFPDFTLSINQLKDIQKAIPEISINPIKIEPAVFNDIIKLANEISSSTNSINTNLSSLNNSALIKFIDGVIQSFDSLSNSILSTQSKIQNLQKFSLSNIDITSLTNLSSTLSTLADSFKIILTPIGSLALSVSNITKGFEKMESIINGIDTSKLSLVTEYSNRINEAGQPLKQNTSNSNETLLIKEQKFAFEPITINLKLDGKDIHQTIVEANAYRI